MVMRLRRECVGQRIGNYLFHPALGYTERINPPEYPGAPGWAEAE